ncbi:MAG: hypothetical protein IT365_00260 [Candidatus Hydrogenedentes bacterium]|nr:hypothetical protein [Candidatus Hydrogenedentota bacterium]
MPTDHGREVSDIEQHSTEVQVTSIEQAIALAELEVHKLGWKKDEFKVISSDFQGGVWRVMIERLPSTPGAHVVIEVTSDGKVTVLGGA